MPYNGFPWHWLLPCLCYIPSIAEELKLQQKQDESINNNNPHRTTIDEMTVANVNKTK
ncbi:protein of unknown function [Shewanella benthica]|uniref:Uncharacterized protein n=1 Tax=Shewanella benthica TaxID=43661 RepID=A0A330LYT9_9GAMM|nr:protein of unknown function [Shewanella benthica]